MSSVNFSSASPWCTWHPKLGPMCIKDWHCKGWTCRCPSTLKVPGHQQAQCWPKTYIDLLHLPSNDFEFIFLWSYYNIQNNWWDLNGFHELDYLNQCWLLINEISGFHLRAISQQVPKLLLYAASLKITLLKITAILLMGQWIIWEGLS